MEGELSALTNQQGVAENTPATPENFSWLDAQVVLKTEGVEVRESEPDSVMSIIEFTNLETLDRLTRTEIPDSRQSFTISTKSPDRNGRHLLKVTIPSGQQEPYLILTHLPDYGIKREIIKSELSRLTPREAKQLLPAVEAGFGISLCGGMVDHPAAIEQESIRDSSTPNQPPSVFKQIEAIFAAKYTKLQQPKVRLKQISPYDKTETVRLFQKYEPRYRAHQHLEARLGPLMRVMQQVRLTAEQPEVTSAFPAPAADLRPSTSPPPAPPETPPEKTPFQRFLDKLQRQPAPEPASRPAMRGREPSPRPEPLPASAPLPRRPIPRPAGPVEKPAKRPDLPPPSMKLPDSW